MSKGQLNCPVCKKAGMGPNSYLYYESQRLNDGQDHFLFYNTQTQFNAWKCWALVEECGCTVHHWYDPCGLCFNPCDHTPDVVTYNVYGQEISRQKDCATGTICCLLFVFLSYVIYFMYFGFFIWYDIYYYFCKSSTTMKSICFGNQEKLYPEHGNYWAEIGPNFYTEYYWCTNFPGLFRCIGCNYQGKSFKEFMEINQMSFNEVQVVNNQNEVINSANQINK